MPSKIHPSVWLQARRGDLHNGQILKQITDSIPPIPEMTEVLKVNGELAILVPLPLSSLLYEFHIC